MCKVGNAKPYVPFWLSKGCCVEDMLVCEFRFPRVFHPSETLLSKHVACLWRNDHEYTEEVFKRFRISPKELEKFAREQDCMVVMNLVLALLAPYRRDVPTEAWTGYRILGTVLETGSPVNWTFQLFAQDLRRKTVVFTTLG